MAKLPPRLTALVLGGAGTLAADKAAAIELFTPDLVIACNHAARDEPGRVDHVATMHPELIDMWRKERRRHGRPEWGQLWHARHRSHHAVKGSKPIESWGGSSGMLCIAVAVELGCTHIVLAGVPMVKMDGHFNDPKPWMEARQYHPAWERRIPMIRDRVRSLSGWTREKLGAPDEVWLNGGGT